MNSKDWIEVTGKFSTWFIKKSTVVGVNVMREAGQISIYIETEKSNFIYASFDGSSDEIVSKARNEAQLLIAEICRSGEFTDGRCHELPPLVGELESDYEVRHKKETIAYKNSNHDFPEFYSQP